MTGNRIVTVKAHNGGDNYQCGKVYLPKEWIGKKVLISLKDD